MSTEPSTVATQVGAAPLILVVGETATVRQAATTLEPIGVRTVSATSARDAVKQLPDLAPDLVLLGGEGIEETGADAVGQIRNPSGSRPPLVVVGGRGGTEAIAGRLDPAADYLPADIGLAELVELLRSKLGRATGASNTAPPGTLHGLS